MNDKILAKRLKELREKNGYLQKFVADKIGVRSNTLSGYENGTRNPDPDIIRNLAKLYNVTTDYLLGHSDQPHMTEEEAFEAFRNNPSLERWYRELPKNKEEDLKRLKKIWEAFKDKED
ncbi:helix-turn-helix transcriptional regulator [Virgibacillus sp. M23]|uniref:helix-turn-helix domain-containing protein n=1 Tax=Virgibacillus sp. M23 TaxID=3079030 RepID=UPI002A91C914|nr:helix-turn-helix transcriptional regulator [Virgibacillus sp. M23]MDY7044391.1 helix-turn-helix transcriptional regulator [Virgibacillus sp. M23]